MSTYLALFLYGLSLSGCFIFSSIHLPANFKISLFFTAEEYFNVQMYYIFSIHSLVERHLGCFQVLTIMSNTAMNIVEQVSICMSVTPLGTYPRVVLPVLR